MDDPLAKSRQFAITGFLALITSALLPWWGLTWDNGQTPIRDTVSLFRPEPPLTTTWGPWLTGILIAVAVLVLFVRIAARSEKHEPLSWHRDLRIALGTVALAIMSALLWPSGVASFWGGRTYTFENGTGPSITETAAPLLGWWVAIVGLLALLVAVRLARPTTPK